MEASNHALYIKEREGKEIVESEKGFATYYYLNDGCYVQDIFVKNEFRKQNVAKEMLDEISNIAKSQGYNKLYGSVVPSTKGSTLSLKLSLEYGFQLDSSINNFIVLTKDI